LAANILSASSAASELLSNLVSLLQNLPKYRELGAGTAKKRIRIGIGLAQE
jgi:hypothetical protein